MAGGIDWFRWHHGTVSDQKFGLIANKAGASVAEVIAVWACLLEAASAATERGDPGIPDFEAMDFALGLQEGKSRRIYERMRERAMIDGESGRIASWEKRQPKRERTDDSSTTRTRAYRERVKSDCDATERQVTPSDATERQETPRVEKRREEVNHLSEVASSESDPPLPESPAANATREGLLCRQLRKAGIQDAAPHLLRRQDWQDLLAKRTDAEIVAVAELKVEQNPGKRISLAYLLPALADEGKTARSGAPPPGKHSGFEKIDYRAGVAPDGRF